MELNTLVQTPYGEGRLIGYREKDDMFVVYLHNVRGVLYCKQESLSRRAMAVPGQLEVGFESLENVIQQLDPEVECREMGISHNRSMCTTCLLDHCKNSPEENKPAKKLHTATSVCIVCENPTCCTHQSTGFKKQGLVLCKTCESLFDLDFYEMIYGVEQQHCKAGDLPTIQEDEVYDFAEKITGHQPDPALLVTKVQHMQAIYCQVMYLLSQYSKYISELQVRLKTTEVRNNHLDVGASATSAMAGVMGLLGATLILTPAGIPLIIASLAVGGCSSALSLGNNAVNWYQQPEKAADRIIALYGLACAILNSTQSLLYIVSKMNPSLSQNEGDVKEVVSTADSTSQHAEQTEQGFEFVCDADDALALAMPPTPNLSKFQNTFPTTATALTQGAGWAPSLPILGALLSGIFLYMDAKRLLSTLGKIQAGNASEKAEVLEKIQSDLLIFPESTEVEKQMQVCLCVIQNQLLDDSNKKIA